MVTKKAPEVIYDLLLRNNLGGKKKAVNADIIFDIRQDALAWVLIPKAVTDIHKLSKWKPRGAAITSLRNLISIRFPFAERGYPLLTTYLSSIISAMNYYLTKSKGDQKSLAFSVFEKRISDEFEGRRIVAQYVLKLRDSNNLELKKFAKAIGPLGKLGIFKSGDIARYPLWVNFHCGHRSSAKDRRELRKAKGLVAQSSSIEGLLKNLIGLPAKKRAA